MTYFPSVMAVILLLFTILKYQGYFIQIIMVLVCATQHSMRPRMLADRHFVLCTDSVSLVPVLKFCHF